MVIYAGHGDDSSVADTESRLAQVDYDDHQLGAALGHARKALGIRQRVQPGDHVETANDRTVLGTILEARGDHDGARRELEQAVAMFERTLGPKTLQLVQPLTCLGEALVGGGHPADAIAPLERAVALVGDNRESPDLIAASRYALARALWAAGRDRARAVSLARSAAAQLARATTTPEVSRKRAEVTAWVAAHAGAAAGPR